MKKVISLMIALAFSTLMIAQNNSSDKEKKANNVKAENKVHYIDRRTEKNQDAKKLPRVINQKKAEVKKSTAAK